MALGEVIHKVGSPEIMNSDQGSKFVSFAWTDRRRGNCVRFPLDGKERILGV